MARAVRLRYKRVVLKLSGEAFCKPGGSGIDADELARIAGEIVGVHKVGAEIAVVCGAGNLVRGASVARRVGLREATAHHMGMLATVINSLALQEALEALDVPARVFSAVPMALVCEPYSRRRAMQQLAKRRVAILGGGTGRPFVTTDTAASLAALELDADALLKATKVDGVYDDDPAHNRKAKRFETLTYDQILRDRLAVMDLGAVEMCRQKPVPLVVFNFDKPGNIRKVVCGEKIGTLVQ